MRRPRMGLPLHVFGLTLDNTGLYAARALGISAAVTAGRFLLVSAGVMTAPFRPE